MGATVLDSTDAIVEFIGHARPPAAARQRAAAAFQDTLGVILAGVHEPASQMARALALDEGRGACRVLGTGDTTSAGWAAFANGVAAHALDFDDMCFVSMAHPSCALVPALLAAGERIGASGDALLDGYIVGFEVECRLGNVMNPRHYHVRGWHATSSIGTVGAAAAAARVLGLDAAATRHALGIAASSACGLKENLGSMVKPLHAGLAARNGLMAAQLAQRGFVASARALDGPQGYLAVMDSEHPSLDGAVADLGRRWEILDTGVTVKLYPSCAATHPPLDVILGLARQHSLAPSTVAAIDVEVDSMTPRLLIYSRPGTALEGKFSMPFCAAAAVAHRTIDMRTFDVARIEEPVVQALIPKVTLRACPAFDTSAPLSRTRVTIRLTDGTVLTQEADGARGYPGRLSEAELAAKFADCAARALATDDAARAWAGLQHIEELETSSLTALLAPTTA